MPYLEMQSLSDIRPFAELGSAGWGMALEGGFIERFGKQVIETIVLSSTRPHHAFGSPRNIICTVLSVNGRKPKPRLPSGAPAIHREFFPLGATPVRLTRRARG